MTGQTITLSNPVRRSQAHRLIDKAPEGAILNIREAKRTSDQNALLWTLLGYVSRAKPQGRNYPPEIWKCLFMASIGHQVRWEPALDGNGVVGVGYRSSRLTKAEMSDLIEAIHAYAAEQGISFEDSDRNGTRSAETACPAPVPNGTAKPGPKASPKTQQNQPHPGVPSYG